MRAATTQHFEKRVKKRNLQWVNWPGLPIQLIPACSQSEPIRHAIQQLSRLPGIGEKTATRLVYWLLRAPEGTPAQLVQALLAIRRTEGMVNAATSVGTTRANIVYETVLTPVLWS